MDTSLIAILVTMIVGFIGMIGSQIGLFNSVNALSNKVGSLEGRLGTLEGIVSSMKEDFGRRLDKLESSAVITANSPLTLKSGASNVFFNTTIDELTIQRKHDLLHYIKDSGAVKDYDVQEAALKAVNELVIPFIDDDSKQYLYDHGFTNESTTKMLGIFVRDLYLNQDK